MDSTHYQEVHADNILENESFQTYDSDESFLHRLAVYASGLGLPESFFHVIANVDDTNDCEPFPEDLDDDGDTTLHQEPDSQFAGCTDTESTTGSTTSDNDVTPTPSPENGVNAIDQEAPEGTTFLEDWPDDIGDAPDDDPTNLVEIEVEVDVEEGEEYMYWSTSSGSDISDRDREFPDVDSSESDSDTHSFHHTSKKRKLGS